MVLAPVERPPAETFPAKSKPKPPMAPQPAQQAKPPAPPAPAQEPADAEEALELDRRRASDLRKQLLNKKVANAELGKAIQGTGELARELVLSQRNVLEALARRFAEVCPFSSHPPHVPCSSELESRSSLLRTDGCGRLRRWRRPDHGRKLWWMF